MYTFFIFWLAGMCFTFLAIQSDADPDQPVTLSLIADRHRAHPEIPTILEPVYYFVILLVFFVMWPIPGIFFGGQIAGKIATKTHRHIDTLLLTAKDAFWTTYLSSKSGAWFDYIIDRSVSAIRRWRR